METGNQGNTNSTGNQGGTANTNVSQGKTFTQEELDQIVKERIYREKEKYTDYEALKEKAARLDELEEKSKTELEKAVEKTAKLQAELEGLKKEKEISGIREKVAKETGIPVDLLTATTEEACKEQALKIQAYAKPTYPNVRDGGEAGSGNKGTAKEQFAEWANNMLTGG